MNFPKIKFEPKLKKIKYNSRENNEKSISKLCQRLHLFKTVSILLPDVNTENLEEFLNSSFYKIKEFSIADALSKSVIEGYIKCGNLIIASTDENIDKNCEFLISGQKLKLKLNKDLFYSLDAVTLNRYQTKIEDEAVTFEVDLTCTDVQKIKNELQNERVDKTAINLTWKSETDDICSSSIAKFFENMKYEVKISTPQSSNNFLFNISLPKIPAPKCDDSEWETFIEYAGMLLLNCDLKENACSSYQMPEDLTEVGRMQAMHFKGFFSSFTLEKVLMEITKILREKNASVPYVVLSTISHASDSSTTIVVSSENIYLAE